MFFFGALLTIRKQLLIIASAHYDKLYFSYISTEFKPVIGIKWDEFFVNRFCWSECQELMR